MYLSSKAKNNIYFGICAVVLVAVLMLASGCATMDRELVQHEELHCLGFTHTGSAPFYEWHKTRPASEKPWFYVRVDDTNKTCRFLGSQASHGERIDACATWKPQGCEIYLPK